MFRHFIKKIDLFKYEKFCLNFISVRQKQLVLTYTRQKNDKKNYNDLKMNATYPFLIFSALLAKEQDDHDETSRRKKFNFIADVVEETVHSIVQVEIRKKGLFGFQMIGSGSGFIVSKDGLILTNAHVIQDKNAELNVKLNDGRILPGRVIKIDISSDLAVIKVEPKNKNLKPVKLGDSSKVRTGEFVVALGSPLSLSNTVTSGVVSNPNRDGTEIGLNNELYYIQTDTMITHGNSGGPLVNLDGEVIGINAMTATPGISFAIPSNYAIDFLENDNKNNKQSAKHYYLGMKMISITPQILRLFSQMQPGDIKIPDDLKYGCLIIEVAPYSPADKAGLKRGDVIINANGKEIQKNSDLLKILKETPNLSLLLNRSNTEINLEIKAEQKD